MNTMANDLIHCPGDHPETRCVEGDHPSVLDDIFRADIDIVIWKRGLAEDLALELKDLDLSRFDSAVSTLVTTQVSPLSIVKQLRDLFDAPLLAWDIAYLSRQFLSLFQLDQARLKLTSLDRTMCPRFHVDRVPCRLVTTYRGMGTEWLPHHVVDRSRLGPGAQGKPDHQSGVYRDNDDIQRLSKGDIALIKGKLWPTAGNLGQVHRSPVARPGESRLLLTLDFVESENESEFD